MSQQSETEERDIRDVRIFPFRRVYITFGTIIPLLGGLAFWTWGLLQENAQSKLELERLRDQLSDLNRHVEELSKTNSTLNRALKTGLLAPVAPLKRHSWIAVPLGSGKPRVELLWIANESQVDAGYYIELRKLGEMKHWVASPYRIQVPGE